MNYTYTEMYIYIHIWTYHMDIKHIYIYLAGPLHLDSPSNVTAHGQVTSLRPNVFASGGAKKWANNELFSTFFFGS